MDEHGAWMDPDFSDLVELLRRRAEERPDAVGYRFLNDPDAGEGEPLTWGGLDRRARAVAAALIRAGASGERALLLYPPGLDYLAAFFGCLYAGTVAVPVYPPRPRPRSNSRSDSGPGNGSAARAAGRVLSILQDARAVFALTTGEVLAGIPREMRPAAGPAWITTDGLDPASAADWRKPDLSSASLAFLQYTSGSTAAPKGVMLTHGNLLHNLEVIRRGFGLQPTDRAVLWLPPYHDMGLIGGILAPLYTAFPVTLFSPMAFLQRPARWVEAVSRFGATVSGGPNFAYDLAVRKTDEAQRAALDLSGWRVAFNGAEPVRSETLVRFARAFAPAGFDRRAFYPCYGLAEGTLFVTGGARGEGATVERFRSDDLEAHRASRAAADEERSRLLVSSGRSVRAAEAEDRGEQ
ncbi:MAG: AMP-binding protein, partial [Acidobacteriota bacterium]